MREKLWEFLNSKIGMTLVGFFFSTVLAGWVSHQYQQLSWQGKKEFEMLQRALTQQEELTKDIAQLMDDRFFWLQKVLWALEAGDTADNIAYLWTNDYYPTVVNWNRQMNHNIYRMRRLTRKLSYDISEKFYTDEDDISYQDPETIHGYYKSTHYAVRSLACCDEIPGFCGHYLDQRRCVTHEDEILKEAQTKIKQLMHSNSQFLHELQQAFDENNDRISTNG